MKSCTSASMQVYKKIERKAESVDKWKKKVKIINNDEFTKVVNVYRTIRTIRGPAPRTTISELSIVELVSNYYEVETEKMKTMIEKVELDGWNVKGPLTSPCCW